MKIVRVAVALVFAFLFLESAASAQVAWLLDGDENYQTSILWPGPGWKHVATADLNGDRLGDLVWRNGVTGVVGVQFSHPDPWYPLSSDEPVIIATVADPHWSIAGAGDIDGDGRADLVWVNDVTHAAVIWLMNCEAIARFYFLEYALAAPPPGRKWVAVVSDLDGDGDGDLIWDLR